MNAIEIIREQGRMCGKTACIDCGLLKGGNCRAFRYEHPEEAVAIIEQWAKEHPAKTYKNVFLEKFPDAVMDNIIGVCIENVFGTSVTECGGLTCEDCWNREVEE